MVAKKFAHYLIRYGTLFHFTRLAGGVFINREIAGEREKGVVPGVSRYEREG